MPSALPLTHTRPPIRRQHELRGAGAGEGAEGVGAGVLAAPVVKGTLVHVLAVVSVLVVGQEARVAGAAVVPRRVVADVDAAAVVDAALVHVWQEGKEKR